MSQTRQVSHLKCWEGTCEDGTAWSFNRHRDSLDITDEELGTSIVSVDIVCCCTCVCACVRVRVLSFLFFLEMCHTYLTHHQLFLALYVLFTMVILCNLGRNAPIDLAADCR